MIEITFKEIILRLNQLELPEVDLIVGIGWGGLVPAALIANKVGCDLRIVYCNYRDEKNSPRYECPQLEKSFLLPSEVQSILLVDDVSVSGKTLESARMLLGACQVKTLVLTGMADYVVFPEITSCVNWPWKKLNRLQRTIP